MDHAALKSEIENDPAPSIGYGSWSDLDDLAGKINAPGSAKGEINRKRITAQDILKEVRAQDCLSIASDALHADHPVGIVSSEYPGAGQARASLFQILIAAASREELDWSDPQIRAQIKQCFPVTHMLAGNPNTRQNIIALEKVGDTKASRAEELFGHDVVVSIADLKRARDVK